MIQILVGIAIGAAGYAASKNEKVRKYIKDLFKEAEYCDDDHCPCSRPPSPEAPPSPPPADPKPKAESKPKGKGGPLN